MKINHQALTAAKYVIDQLWLDHCLGDAIAYHETDDGVKHVYEVMTSGEGDRSENPCRHWHDTPHRAVAVWLREFMKRNAEQTGKRLIWRVEPELTENVDKYTVYSRFVFV